MIDQYRIYYNGDYLLGNDTKWLEIYIPLESFLSLEHRQKNFLFGKLKHVRDDLWTADCWDSFKETMKFLSPLIGNWEREEETPDRSLIHAGDDVVYRDTRSSKDYQGIVVKTTASTIVIKNGEDYAVLHDDREGGMQLNPWRRYFTEDVWNKKLILEV